MKLNNYCKEKLNYEIDGDVEEDIPKEESEINKEGYDI